MSEHPIDLHKLFKIDDKSVATRAMLDQLGHHLRQILTTGKPTISFQVDRDVAAVMADLFILDDTP